MPSEHVVNVKIEAQNIETLATTSPNEESMVDELRNHDNTAKLIPEITPRFFMYLEGLRFASRAC
jgi:hypothetical protein